MNLKSLILWHCGVAPCNLWDGKCERALSTYFAGGKGVTADFVLKDGEVSIVRFDKPVQEVFDLVVQNGIAHHASVVYGEFLEPFRIFAKIKGWEVI